MPAIDVHINRWSRVETVSFAGGPYDGDSTIVMWGKEGSLSELPPNCSQFDYEWMGARDEQGLRVFVFTGPYHIENFSGEE